MPDGDDVLNQVVAKKAVDLTTTRFAVRLRKGRSRF